LPEFPLGKRKVKKEKIRVLPEYVVEVKSVGRDKFLGKAGFGS
jgi:hypothetical protein